LFGAASMEAFFVFHFSRLIYPQLTTAIY